VKFYYITAVMDYDYSQHVRPACQRSGHRNWCSDFWTAVKKQTINSLIGIKLQQTVDCLCNESLPVIRTSGIIDKLIKRLGWKLYENYERQYREHTLQKLSGN